MCHSFRNGVQGTEQCGEEEKSEFGFQLAEPQILL